MKLNIRRGTVLVEPVLRHKEQTSKIAGFEFAKPEMQGVPNTGVVRVIADDEKELKVGDKIVFKDEKPKAFRWEDVGYFLLQRDTVQAIITEGKDD